MSEKFYIEKTMKYIEQIKSGQKIEQSLKRLKEIPMNLNILTTTGVGKVINQLKSDENFGRTAQKLVEKWKELAKVESLRKQEQRNSTTYERSASPPESTSTSGSSREVSNRKRKSAEENGRESKKNGLSVDPFAAMLSAADKVKSQPIKTLKKPKLPSADEISAEVLLKPPVINFDNFMTKAQNNEKSPEELDPQQFKARKNIRKVFAGRKKEATFRGPIPKLFDICIQSLQSNIDIIGLDCAINYLYARRKLYVPYDIIKPVLEKCNENQLAKIEEKNQYFERESDELWKKLCNKKFPETNNPEYEEEWDGSWKPCFKSLSEKRDEKLEKAKKKIAQHVKEITIPQRQTIISDAITPRHIRRKQAKNGLSAPAYKIPTAVEVSKSRRQIFENGNKADLKSLPISVRNTSSELGAHSSRSSASIKVQPSKKGTLMVKALKMMKGGRR